ncbi:Epoxide hydrolase [Burkholderiales bacterium 8X]|nr:Epoxide hydrolase [Burkholderiales bacterium 8X]
MIETFKRELPNGCRLSCRASGPANAPLMVFLHGFPEAAFIWDPLLEHFSRPENGGFRCVAPNLRGFEKSSSPTEVAAYRAHLLAQDILQLVQSESRSGQLDVLVAHDWGGAVAWLFANAHADRLGKLVIINSPHPGTFARELLHNPEQQAASAYMNFLARPDAEALLSADDYQRMWSFFTLMKAGPGGFGWLTDEVKAQYREVWDRGLTGACNYYRVTPMKPAQGGGPPSNLPELPPERFMVQAPTLVLWALDDAALLPGLIEGLDAFVPRLQLKKIPGATHWIVHEQPEQVAREIQAFVGQ